MSETPSRIAFVGGRVWTAGYAEARELDVLVEGDRIAEVAAPGTLDTAGAEIQDVSGKLLTPGFQDAHLHMYSGGADLLGCDLARLETADEVYAKIKAYADANPDLEWIIGGGWNRVVFPYPEGPTKEALDAIVPDRPVVMSPFDRHGMWVNSAAMAVAGIDASTPDPELGHFRRNEDGSLRGMLEEGGMAPVAEKMPEITRADIRAAILRAQEYVASFGITSVQDALVGSGLGMSDPFDAYEELVAGDELSVRITTALWWEPTRGVEQVADLLERRARLEAAAGPDRVVADMVKIMVDGSDTTFIQQDELRAAILAADAAGFNMHFHSYADVSTTWILDGIEEAIRVNGPRRRRNHIAHLFVVAPHDYARFGELGVSANVQGLWAGSSVPHDHIHPSATPDPVAHEYPFGRMHAAGTPLAAGSDWPVTTPDPFLAARTAAGDYPVSDGYKEMSPTDRLDPVAMLTAFTTGSAYVNGRADRTGRVAPGFLADLAILDRDVIGDPAALAEVAVDETWIGGRRVFRRG